jgi:hypothetical protein
MKQTKYSEEEKLKIIADQKKLIIRSDNGPQMSSWHFKAYVDSLI